MKSQQLFKQPWGRLAAILAVSSALGAGAIATYAVLHYRADSQTTVPNTLVSQTSMDAVAALGYLEPEGEVIQLSAPTFIEGAGTRVEQLLVQRGQRVKAGEAIAILDNRDRLQAALEEAKTQVTVAQARLQQVQAGAKQGNINAQDARFEATQAELEGQISTQKATISRLEAQLQGERSAQEATIQRLKAELRNAQTNCQRYQILYEDGAVSDQERDNFCLQAETAQESLKEAQANLTRIVSTLQERVSEAHANLERTVTTLERQVRENQATLDAVREVRPVDVQVAMAELESAQAMVQRAQADLDLAYVRSPREGQVLKIHTWPGEMVSEQGIVEIGQTDQMYAIAEVYETDINRIKLAQKATIKTDGITDDLQGIISDIGLQIGRKDVLGTDPVADADARVVEVKIRLTPESSQKVAGLTNLQVNVIIDTSPRSRPESTFLSCRLNG